MNLDLNKLAEKIDKALATLDATALHQNQQAIESINQESLTNIERATLDFYLANILSGIHQAEGSANIWNWNQPHCTRQIYHLRRALIHLEGTTAQEYKTDLRFRITTNLANTLDHVGRFIEAIELWDETLEENPYFGMAAANKGEALFLYARHAKDTGDEALLLRESFRSYKSAWTSYIEEHAREKIYQRIKFLEKIHDCNSPEIAFPKTHKRHSKRESRYRRWCVKNRLALSPINDIITVLDAIDDTLTLPDMIFSLQECGPEIPTAYAIFNQLKQEYASIRFLTFEAFEEKEKRFHFADRGIVLYDALDYRYYRLWIEKLKMAFLSAHAIFDKIAFLINEYWKLSLNSRSISFNAIWHKNGDTRAGLSKKFSNSQNWPLRGLYWLSRDIYQHNTTPHAIEPEAKTIHNIRQHIAHKYLTVHDHHFFNVKQKRSKIGTESNFPISDEELQKYTIKLLKLVRSALIYLTSAISHEENDKKNEMGEINLITMPIPIVSEKYRL